MKSFILLVVSLLVLGCEPGKFLTGEDLKTFGGASSTGFQDKPGSVAGNDLCYVHFLDSHDEVNFQLREVNAKLEFILVNSEFSNFSVQVELYKYDSNCAANVIVFDDYDLAPNETLILSLSEYEKNCPNCYANLLINSESIGKLSLFEILQSKVLPPKKN